MFAYWGIKLAQRLFGILPADFVRFLGRCLGAAAFYLDGKHRAIALNNLRMVFSGRKSERELRVLARKSFSQLGFNLVEFLRVPCLLRPGWEKNFRISGAGKIEKAFARGRGIIFVLAHFGNWEYLGFVPRLLSFRGAAVGQEIKNPAIDGLIKDLREQIGLELLPKFEVSSSILNCLKMNRAVAILADQRARKMKVRVDFLGHPADTSQAPAVLAIKSGAAILPAFIYFEEANAYHIVIEDEIAIPSGLSPREAARQVAQKINLIFAEKILKRPELWMWGHRRWKTIN